VCSSDLFLVENQVLTAEHGIITIPEVQDAQEEENLKEESPRAANSAGQKEEVKGLACRQCGKVCKSYAGRLAHERRCKA
jgi:hypothetical protein